MPSEKAKVKLCLCLSIISDEGVWGLGGKIHNILIYFSDTFLTKLFKIVIVSAMLVLPTVEVCLLKQDPESNHRICP
jgi:hypothetical protein